MIDDLGAQYFGAVLSGATVEQWRSRQDQVQVIGQAELFPLVVARLTWAERLCGRRVLFFIDNDSARQALIKSYSPVLASLRIVLDCLKWDMDNQSNAWYARVPTASNIADGPSRMSSWEVVRALSAQPAKPIFPKNTGAACILE